MNQRSVLLVDDEPEFLAALRRLLELHGCQVVTARDEIEALMKLHQQQFDVVITDLLLENGDGFAVIQAATRLLPRPRIVAASGGGYKVGPTQLLPMARAFGAIPLAKPFSRDELFVAAGLDGELVPCQGARQFSSRLVRASSCEPRAE